VAIDALNGAIGCSGEKMTEGDVTAQVGRTDDDGNERRRKNLAADLDGAADATDCG
jgi:hypothetical protein